MAMDLWSTIIQAIDHQQDRNQDAEKSDNKRTDSPINDIAGAIKKDDEKNPYEGEGSPYQDLNPNQSYVNNPNFNHLNLSQGLFSNNNINAGMMDPTTTTSSKEAKTDIKKTKSPTADDDKTDYKYVIKDGVLEAEPGTHPNVKVRNSDARLKDAQPDQEMDVLKNFSEKIQNYTWHYKPDNKAGLDPTKLHIGPMAQDLLNVPGLDSTVVQDPRTGYLQVDPGQLSLANTGIMSDIAKRLQVVEEIVMQFVQMMQQSQMQQQQQMAQAQQGGGIGGI